MMSAEDFGGVRDRSTEVLLTQRCVSLQRHNSAFYSTTLSFPSVFAKTAAGWKRCQKREDYTKDTELPPLPSNCLGKQGNN